MFWTLVLVSDLELTRTVEDEHSASSMKATEAGVPQELLHRNSLCCQGRETGIPHTQGKVLHWTVWPPSPPLPFHVKTFQLYP